MNNYIAIEKVARTLSADYDWPHSFVRECYLTSSRTLVEWTDSDGGETQLGEAGYGLHARVMVATIGHDVHVAIEFLFRNVGTFLIANLDELSFDYSWSRNGGHFVLLAGSREDLECFFLAESVLVRFYDRSFDKVAYSLGYEFPTTDAYDATPVEGCWRHCSNCQNIWEESPNVEFSRCPSCGFVTKLKTF